MNHLIEKEFGLTVDSLELLIGYDNKNYILISNGSQFILKTYEYSDETFEVVLAENEVLLSLEEKLLSRVPRVIPFTDGALVKVLDVEGTPIIIRLLSFMEGSFLGDVSHTKEVLSSFGTFLAQLDFHLRDLRNPVIKSRQWEWDIQYLNLNRKYLEDIDDPKTRNILLYFFKQYEEVVTPVTSQLRKQIIHNDANEWNVLVQDGSVSGIIDFGDLAHSYLINELAVAVTYGIYDKEDPLEHAKIIVAAYHKMLPLLEVEIKVLYYLIAARLCISLCNSAHARKVNPENSYASISEKFALKLLYKWIEINPIYVENEFRSVTNFSKINPPKIEDILKMRKQHFGANLSISYKEPIHMNRAAFQYMYDAEGNTFLDAYNNIPHVGHSHPRVVEAGQRQFAQLNTNTRYLYNELNAYAERLLSHFPDSLCKVYLVNSGSAASDLAIRMAQFHTQAKNVMVMELGYHGNTQTSIDISDYKFNNPKGEGQKSHIIKTALPSEFRGKYAGIEGAGDLYGEEAVALIQETKEPIAAFISEPIVGCAGQIPLAPGYLRKIYPAIRAQGGVCISDEVQTGFGRLGDHFWGFEAQDVVPDLVVLGKSIANGHPMGAVVCTKEIAASFDKGVEFFSSFGGNPVSCAIASAVLEVVEEEKLQENAKLVGAYYKGLLEDLATKYSVIGNVRGSGLFLGVEIVKKDSLEPNTDLAQYLKNKMRERHILLSTDGPFDNVIKTKPPLCFTKKNAEKVVNTLDDILESVPK